MKILKRFNPSNVTLNEDYYSACWGYVAPDNREYAILGSFDGTYFYDITNSSNIVEVGFVPTPTPGPSANHWREMKTYSHYAYVVSELSGSGVQIIDLQYLPDSVHYVTKFEIPGYNSTHSISQSGPYLYLNDPDGPSNVGILVLDLSVNPELPVARGIWNTYYVHDSRIVNDTIWACNINDGYVSLIDGTNKDSLRTIGQWSNLPDPAPHNIALTPDRKYAYVTDETTTGPGKLKIWDVSDIGNILFMNSWVPSGFETSIVHNVEIYDTLAVIAYYSAGIRVLNISDPVNPVEIAWYDTYPDNNVTWYDGCWGVYRFPSGKMVASDQKYGAFIFQTDFTSTPSMPVADFEANKRQFESMIGDTVKLFDFSSGYPDSWEWTVTGPQNLNFSQQNPKFVPQQPGIYTVKLRVSNSAGSDSLERINYITVIPTILHPFAFTTTGVNTILTSPADTSKVTFKWTRPSLSPVVTYKFRAQKFGGTAFRWLDSDNNGTDTSITFTKSYLDSLARDFGLNGDSLLLSCRAYAYTAFDSAASGNTLILNIKTNSVGINIISSEIPGEFKLDNNYPNPFNPETNIQYQLPKAAFVTIKLYDVMGREVRTLVNEKHDAGYYNYRFNANGLSSGVYFYKIQAGDYSDIKRMMLIK